MRADYYSGFEGYESITLYLEGKQSPKIEVWHEYFRDLMESVKPNELGHWEGLALYYHTHTGWYEERDWPLDNIGLAIDQLCAIKVEGDDKDLLEELRDSIVSLLKSALQLNRRAFIEYD